MKAVLFFIEFLIPAFLYIKFYSEYICVNNGEGDINWLVGSKIKEDSDIIGSSRLNSCQVTLGRACQFKLNLCANSLCEGFSSSS